MFRFEFQKLWIIYLVTSSTLFTLPEPVFSQHQSIYLRSTANNQTAAPESTGSSDGEGGAEPMTSGSNLMTEETFMTAPEAQDNVVAAESMHRFRGRRPPPKGRPRGPPRPNKRHPPHRGKDEHGPGPREKPILIKPGKLMKHKHKKPFLPVPKLRSKPMFERFRKPHPPPPRHEESHEEERRPPPSPRVPMSRPPPPTPPTPEQESAESSEDSSVGFKANRASREESYSPRSSRKESHNPHHNQHPSPHQNPYPNSHQNQHPNSHQNPHSDPHPNQHSNPHSHPESSREERQKPRQIPSRDKLIAQSFLKALFPSAQDSTVMSDENPRANKGQGPGQEQKSALNHKTNNPQPSPSNPASSFQGERPKEGYIVTDDKYELNDLMQNHHLRRRKECDGVENFIYDMELIAFLLGVIAAVFGVYSDVIPFFNEGVKISYSNNIGGDGADFPHDYWPKHDAYVDARSLPSELPTEAVPLIPTVGTGRMVAIGTNADDVKQVMSVTGEFIGLLGLAISFVALFPSWVEKFFYSLDWWFGKRGLWKQYLYTYKCEIHTYPQPGWGKVG